MKRISFIIILFTSIFTSCKKDPTTPPANTSEGFLLVDNGDCQSASVIGRIYNGVKADDSSYVEVSVKVTKKGSYHIITDDQDGSIFVADGNFADTGIQKVRLKPKGTFTNWGTLHFVTAYNSSPCHLSVNIYDSAYRDQPDNTWQFTANGKVYKGTGTALYTHLPTYAADTYSFFGSMEGASDTSLIVRSLVFNFEHPDDYNHYTSDYFNSFAFKTAASAPPPALAFTANTTTAPTAVVDIVNSGYSRVYKFTGTAKDADGNIIQITDGRYRADTSQYVDYE